MSPCCCSYRRWPATVLLADESVSVWTQRQSLVWSTELPKSGRTSSCWEMLREREPKQTKGSVYLRCPRYPWLWDCVLWWCSQWWCWRWDYSRETPAGLLVSPEEHTHTHTQTNTAEYESPSLISDFIREYQTPGYSLACCVILYHCPFCSNLLVPNTDHPAPRQAWASTWLTRQK